MDCLWCGKPCPPSRRARPRRFCTDAHRIKYNNAKRENRVNYPADPAKKKVSRKRYRDKHPDQVKGMKRRWYHKYAESIWFRKLLKRRGTLTPEELEVILTRRENRGKEKGAATRSVQHNRRNKGGGTSD